MDVSENEVFLNMAILIGNMMINWFPHVMLITSNSQSGFLGAISGFLGTNSMFFHGSGTQVLWK
jgi:hypothetical protein